MDLTELEIEELKKLLQRRSRFVWRDVSAVNHTVNLLNNIRAGVIKLEDMLPGGIMSYHDYLFERDLLKFVNIQPINTT